MKIKLLRCFAIIIETILGYNAHIAFDDFCYKKFRINIWKVEENKNVNF